MTDYAGCYPPAHYEAARQRGDLLVLRDDHGIAACAVLHQDDERWPTALQSAKPAFYLHHLAARVSAKGAGTGGYSIALAKAGYAVTAVELLESNLSILRQNDAVLDTLSSLQGDATDLSGFADDAFDVTLLFGPMYHLYDPRDVHRALDEAIRVTRPGGVILTAFLSVHAILFNSYLNGGLLAGLKENFGDDGRIRHFEEQLFTGYDIAEFEALFAGKHVQHLVTAAADNILELAEERCNFAMSDEEFPRLCRPSPGHLRNPRAAGLLQPSAPHLPEGEIPCPSARFPPPTSPASRSSRSSTTG